MQMLKSFENKSVKVSKINGKVEFILELPQKIVLSSHLFK